jgi:hypothetical protein
MKKCNKFEVSHNNNKSSQVSFHIKKVDEKLISLRTNSDINIEIGKI